MLTEQSKNQNLSPEESDKIMYDAFCKTMAAIAKLNLKPGDSKIIECPICSGKYHIQKFKKGIVTCCENCGLASM